MNAITVFVLSGMLGRLAVEIRVGESALKTWLFKNSFGMIPDPRLASLCWALMWVLLLYGVAWAMHRRKWFVRF
jgi:predicted acyltransferase